MDFTGSVMQDGAMTPPNRTSVASPESGVLERIFAKPGERWTLRILACLFALACDFHTEIGSSFTMLLGDALDGQIQTSILQHWYNVFRGLEAWNNTAYFYPWENTLGYNDGFFLNGILYSISRLLGSDPFLASEIVSIALRTIGFFAFEAFATSVLALDFGWALLGALLVTLSNNITVQSAHGQLLTVSFAPLLGLLLWRGLQALPQSDGRAILWGGSAALLYAAWLLSGFYMAWFMTLFVVLLAAAAAIEEAAGRGVGWRAWRGVVRWELIPVGAIASVAILPFLFVYIPKVMETGGHPFARALDLTPAPLDFLHIGSHNLLFGGVDRWLSRTLRDNADDYSELTIGFPPVLAVLAVTGTAFVLGRASRSTMLVRSIALATLTSVVILVRIGPVSLWYVIYHLFPGATGVRVTCRYVLFLTFPVVVLAISVLQARAKTWPGWVVGVVAALLVVEEISVGTTNIGVDRINELRLLSATPPPPPTCSAFVVQTLPERPSTGSESIDSFYLHNVDAMMLAETFAVPAINGFATFNPPDWNFASAEKPGYAFRVARYVDDHKIEAGLCGLDLARHVWTTTPALPIAHVALGATISFRKDNDYADQYIDKGFSAPDKNGQLIDTAEAKLIFILGAPPAPGDDLDLQLDAVGRSLGNGLPPPLTVEVNGQAVATWQPVPGPQMLKGRIPARLIGADSQLRVQFRVISPRTSLFVRAPKGSKRIGLRVQSLRIVAVPAGGAPAGAP